MATLAKLLVDFSQSQEEGFSPKYDVQSWGGLQPAKRTGFSRCVVSLKKFTTLQLLMARKLIPDSLESQPVLLCIDDTMVSKFGVNFENVSKLFDYAAHNGSNYLNGHCFVSLMLCVPVWIGNKINYLSVPLEYRMWQKNLVDHYAALDLICNARRYSCISKRNLFSYPI